MLRYRGSDDTTVGFGHFSEANRVKSGPLDTFLSHPAEGIFQLHYIF